MERLLDAAVGEDDNEEDMLEELVVVEPDEAIAEEESADEIEVEEKVEVEVTMVEEDDDEDGEDMVENVDLDEDGDEAELMDEEESVCTGLIDDPIIDPIAVAEAEGKARTVKNEVGPAADAESTCITACPCPCPCGCNVDMASRAAMNGTGRGTASTARRKGRRAMSAVVKLAGLYMSRDGDQSMVE